MPLQFIFGPSGSGKSHHLYQHIIKESMDHPQENYMVLVPEQFTMQTQKDLVSMHPNHGIMNIDVLSFGRLAYRVFQETGGESLPVLDDEGKNLILRKIAGEYEDKLTLLRGNMRKLGYISEVKSAISEFSQYAVGVEDLDEALKSIDQNSRLYFKLKDIQILYKGFGDYLEKKYITKEELLEVLKKEVPKSKLLKKTTVVLDGFTGFTPVQDRLIYELLKHCRKLMITVTMDDRENPYVYTHPYQLFGLSKKMVASILDLARESGTIVEEPVKLYSQPVYRFRNTPALGFLEKQLFRYEKESYKGKTDEISLHVARNPEEETKAVAEDIRRLVRTTACRYREIGVIVSDMETYGDYLERQFLRYEIPFFMDHNRSILLNSFVEHLRSLLNLMEEGFSYESVFRYLRSNMSGFTLDEVDRMENYVLATGIKGFKNWQKPWEKTLRNTTEESLEDLNHLRVHFVEKIQDLYFVMRQRKKTVKDITLGIYDYMVREEVQLALKKQEDAFALAGELSLSKEYAQVYRVVIELFDKFVELLGEEQVSIKEYCELLDAGLEEARIGLIPPSLDQVLAGDLTRTRLKDIKTLYFLGANDTKLPGNLNRNGILSERDRERLKENDIHLAPGGKEEAYVQKFYLYTNLTKPSRELKIYYSKVSSDGKSLRPAYLIWELRRLFPDLSLVDEEEKTLKERELTSNIAIEELIWGIRNHKTKDLRQDSQWAELFKWYKKAPQWREKIQSLLDAGYKKNEIDALKDQVAKKLYGEDFNASISRIETYSACAYAHFLKYGLRLLGREEYGFEPMDLGNVCHGVLEDYAKQVKKLGKRWSEIGKEESEDLLATSIEKVIKDYRNDLLYSSWKNEYMITAVENLMRRTIWALTKQLSVGDFEPEAFELSIGSSGKIDRLDTCVDDHAIYVKVVDYKTGRKEFDIQSLYYGLQLQLMFYMDSAVKIQQKKNPTKEVIPAGVFYYRIQDPYVDRKGSGEKENIEEIEKDILKALKPDGVINLKDEVLNHLDHKMSGESVAVPVKFNKDGSLAKTSKVVAEEHFRIMMEYATKKIIASKEEIKQGNIKAEPYRQGDSTGCDYCEYKHICKFDTRLEGYHYRNLKKLSKEEAISKMQGFGNGEGVDEGKLDS